MLCFIPGGGGGGGDFQVSLVPMLKQRIEKYTLNSVLKISKTGTLFTMFPTKGTPFHYVPINIIFFLSDYVGFNLKQWGISMALVPIAKMLAIR